MNLSITVNEAPTGSPVTTTANKQVRVHFNEVDAGQVSGPFTSEAAESFAVAAISRSDVVSVNVENVE